MKHFYLAIALAGALPATCAATASAQVLAQHQATGPEVISGYLGQSFTVIGTGQFNAQTFTFYGPSSTPTAVGSLYLFTTRYNGTVDALSTTTANRVGVGTSSNGFYNFSSDTVLTGGVQYFAYADATFGSTPFTRGNDYAGGGAFQSTARNSQFFGLANLDLGFQLVGSVVTPPVSTPAVPEPATWALMLVGFGLVGAGMRSRRRSITFANA